MRQISMEETGAVSGAACGDVTMSVSITGVSLSGSLDDWSSCFTDASNWISDTYNGYYGSTVTGIPSGMAHVG